MYVARLGDGFIVKRMPNTGAITRRTARRTSRPQSCPAWIRCSVPRSRKIQSRA
jgi:hypothetical protein